MKRYIEESEVIKGIRNNLVAGDYIYWQGDDVEDEVANFPSADVVEVKRGKWIPSRFKTLKEDGWFECSLCGVGNKLYDRGIRKSDVPYIDGKPYELKKIANYCSNCGAKMDERREDG